MLGASIRKKGYKMSTGTNVSKESVMLHECVIQMREREREVALYRLVMCMEYPFTGHTSPVYFGSIVCQSTQSY